MLSWLELSPRKRRSAICSLYPQNPPTQECPVSSHRWNNAFFILGKTCSNLLILKLTFSEISRYDCECRRTLSNHYWFLGICSVPHASPGTPTTLIVILKVGICNLTVKRGNQDPTDERWSQESNPDLSSSKICSFSLNPHPRS